MDEMNQNTTKFNSQNLKCQNLKKKKKCYQTRILETKKYNFSLFC